MGRLFWKIFAGFWIILAVTVFGVGAALTVYNQTREESNLIASGRRTDYAIRLVITMFRHGKIDAVQSLLKEWPYREGDAPLVIDPAGLDLIGRPVPAEALEDARKVIESDPDTRIVRRYHDPAHGEFLLFLPSLNQPPARIRPPQDRGLLPPLRVETPLLLIVVALFASLAVSALLARHFSRPIHNLQEAFSAAGRGDLNVRVSQTMGERRDEIADLGRGFDHMAQQFQQLIGAQTRLLHDVSHELRSPLARLQVAVGLARQNPAQIEAALNRIERESERLDVLVGEVLTLSRLEAPSTQHANDYIDIIELLASITDDARFEAEGSSRRVEFTCAVERELVIRARAELLHRAIENVVRNALRHTPPDSTVELHLSEDGSAHSLCITVSDSGPGVPENDLGAIFEPFFRSETAGTGGYGLGLAIARRAIETHGGRMFARNRSVGGLEVLIELPAPAA